MSKETILTKLDAATKLSPLPFGALIEAIEEKAWDALPRRHCSMRLMNMADDLFEYGLDLYLADLTLGTATPYPHPSWVPPTCGCQETEWKS